MYLKRTTKGSQTVLVPLASKVQGYLEVIQISLVEGSEAGSDAGSVSFGVVRLRLDRFRA